MCPNTYSTNSVDCNIDISKDNCMLLADYHNGFHGLLNQFLLVKRMFVKFKNPTRLNVDPIQCIF